jgi:hypothetical protein
VGFLAGHKKGFNLLGWRLQIDFSTPGDTHDGRAQKQKNRDSISDSKHKAFLWHPENGLSMMRSL